MHCPIQESKTLRLPASALIHCAALPPVGILALSILSKDTTARYDKCGHRTINLTIIIWRSNIVHMQQTRKLLFCDGTLLVVALYLL